MFFAFSKQSLFSQLEKVELSFNFKSLKKQQTTSKMSASSSSQPPSSSGTGSPGGSLQLIPSSSENVCKLCAIPIPLNLRWKGGAVFREENLQRMSYIVNFCHEMNLCLHESAEGCSSTNFPLCDGCFQVFRHLWISEMTKESLDTVSNELKTEILKRAREGMVAEMEQKRELSTPESSSCFLCSNLPLVPVSGDNFCEMLVATADKAICPPSSAVVPKGKLPESTAASSIHPCPVLPSASTSSSAIMVVNGPKADDRVLPFQRVSVIRENPVARRKIADQEEKQPDFLCESCGHRTLDTAHPPISSIVAAELPSPSPTPPPPLQEGNKGSVFRRRFLPPSLVRMPRLTPAPGLSVEEAGKVGKRMKIAVEDENHVTRDFTITCIDITSDDDD